MLRRDEKPPVSDLACALLGGQPIPQEILDYVFELLVENKGKLPGGTRGRPKKGRRLFEDEIRDHETGEFLLRVEHLTNEFKRSGHRSPRKSAFAAVAEERGTSLETVERYFRAGMARCGRRPSRLLSLEILVHQTMMKK
jgi:hypothetical protein